MNLGASGSKGNAWAGGGLVARCVPISVPGGEHLLTRVEDLTDELRVTYLRQIPQSPRCPTLLGPWTLRDCTRRRLRGTLTWPPSIPS